MGRRYRRSLVLTNSQGKALGLEMDEAQRQEAQRAEAVSRLKLLPAPIQADEQVRSPETLISRDTPASGMLLFKVQQKYGV